MDLSPVVHAFLPEASVVSVQPWGGGHINDTYLVTLTDAPRMILQRLNTRVFAKPRQVQENIQAVTRALKAAILQEGGDPLRESLTFLETPQGLPYCQTKDGSFYRMMLFVEDTLCRELPRCPQDMYETGAAFGTFQHRLSSFPAHTLHETIPGFHHTPSRLRQLREAIARDQAGRLYRVEPECRFLLDRAGSAALLQDAAAAGQLPLRVTHNDTKCANVLLDASTGRGLCVCDLDTVMPGLSPYDYGDALRSGACTAKEDEGDLSLVHLSLEMARAFTDGFLEKVRYPASERELLPLGFWMITYEQAMRFLADYLDGDLYYKTEDPEQNLRRTRCQIALLSDIEVHRDALQSLI